MKNFGNSEGFITMDTLNTVWANLLTPQMQKIADDAKDDMFKLCDVDAPYWSVSRAEFDKTACQCLSDCVWVNRVYVACYRAERYPGWRNGPVY